ncbi:RNA exonuclease 4-like isoform X3 [Coffea arabica]|uniref:RNA exonuclease 4 n=1 Tax=Coffea arabica TaxID=13443 RepID=A0ABM4VX06_COFAR
MELAEDPPQQVLTTTTIPTIRHKCAACFKQYKKKEHLIEHMKASYHSIHQPKCGVNCLNHLVQEYLQRGVAYFAWNSLTVWMLLQVTSGMMKLPCVEPQINKLASDIKKGIGRGYEAIALDCEMVGGGSNGSLDLCARVCLVDEYEKILFHTYVLPQIPVTDYRFEVTGIKEEHLKGAMPLKEVQDQILQILCNGESVKSLWCSGGQAKVLVGHNLEHDLDCLRMNYPDHLLRDTAKYHPLMKTNLVSHSLKYLTKTFLGYDIQIGARDPYEDCVSVMRLYKIMRSQDHRMDGIGWSLPVQDNFCSSTVYDSYKLNELEQMTPVELFRISRSNYKCWCLDSSQAFEHACNTCVKAEMSNSWRK